VKNKKVVVSSGVGTHQQLVARYFNFSYPNKRWLTSAGHGTMGYDLPSAIGALIANKTFDFGIVFVGDGSFQMNIQELANVVKYNLPIKIFVLDNERLGIVSQFQLLNWKTDESTGSKSNPSFYKIGNAYDINSFEVNKKQNIKEILDKVFSNNNPALIHCKIDHTEDVLPMLMGGQKMNQMYPFIDEVSYE
jgi:acetolactate synthase-1/2/3 large subunit